jgi:hypothetical protein
VEELGSRWNSVAHATVLTLLIAMGGCQTPSTKQAAAPPPETALTLSQPQLTFGTVSVNSNGTLSETLTNSGASSVTVSQATLTSTGFSLSGLALPLALAPRQSTTFSVVFAPTSVGATTSSLLLVNDGGSPLMVSLSGTGAAVSPNTFSISGTISPATNGSGATVTLSGATSLITSADSSGTFSFTGLANGSYSVTPSKSGFGFTPPSQSATLSSSNITGVNFTASLAGAVSINPGGAIQTAVNANPAGTTFVLQPGIYRLQSSIIPKNGDSFIGQTACAPPTTSCPTILSGSTVIGSSATFDGTNYEVTGQTQQGLQQYTNKCEPGWEGCFYPEDLFFDGVPLQHLYSGSLPTILTGQWWFDYTNHIIYFHDNPSGHTVETSVVPTVAGSPSWPGASNITFQYLTIEEFAAPLQQGAVDPTSAGGGNPNASLNWVVKNCELLLNHGLGVHLNYGIQILDNYIHNNGQMGIGGGTNSGAVQSGIVLFGNTITHNNYTSVNSGFGAGGIKIGNTLGAVVRGNVVANNAGGGIHFDVDSRAPLIDGNTVTDNSGGSGIVYEVSLLSALVRNNILQRNGATDTFGNGPGWNLQSQNSTGLEAYCNLIEMNNLAGANGFVVGAADRGNDPTPPYQYLTSTRNYFHHNTVIWNSGPGGAVGYMQNDPTNQPNFFANNTPPDYNTYHLSSLSATSFLYDNNNSGTNTLKTFADYQAAGADVNGTADTNYTSGFPTVAITSPADQSSVANPVMVATTASDASGISKVEFYVDWSLQATVSSGPYNFNWTGATTGAHTVAAMAYSNAGVRSCYAVTLYKQ